MSQYEITIKKADLDAFGDNFEKIHSTLARVWGEES